ncbi:MAG: hypothetical protein IAF38_11485 [Bacteroidia bacterium]|nr:hypothetical protein [Bacteroidia bacterium]
MTEIKKLAEEIYNKDKTKSYQDLVENFEKNKVLIDKINYQESDETYDIYSQLMADYGIALAEIESYAKALPVLNTALELFQKNKKYSNDQLQKLKFYEMLLFNRGRSNYYLYNYKIAVPDFTLLKKLYPENSVYQNWLTAIQTIALKRATNILWYCGTGAIIIELCVKTGTIAKDIMIGLMIFILLSALLMELFVYRRRKNFKK